MSHSPAQSLWRTPGVLPFLGAAFLNAFTDLGHKIIIQNTLLKTLEGAELTMFSALIQGMILLPFLMIFTPAGYLSDKYPKEKIMRIAAFAAIPIISGILVCYHLGEFWWAFGLTFLLGMQAAIYSPAKYGFVKDLVGKERLAQANSALQGTSIVAILGGTVAYSVLFELLLKDLGTGLSQGQILQAVQVAGWLLLLGAVCEFIMTLRLPKRTETFTEMQFKWGHYVSAGYLREHLVDAFRRPVIWQSIFGLSVFYGVNQVILSNFAAYMKEVSGTDNSMLVNGLQGMAGLGIILGSIYASRVSKNYIETGLIPLGAAGISVCLFLFPMLTDVWMIGALFLGLGFFGGTFIVPLFSLIQFHSRQEEAGHIQASNNFAQTLVMVSFLAGTYFLAQAGMSQSTIFWLLAGVTAAGTLWTVQMLPMSLVRLVLRMISRARYRLNVVGLDNMPATGGVLLLGNHVSWFDWAMLQIASPRPVRFVMKRAIYEKWFLRWLMDRLDIIPISGGAAAEALRDLSEALKRGDVVAIFPEGHISKTGTLGQFKAGFEKAALGTGAAIVPFYLHGLWGTVYSYARELYRKNSRGQGTRTITVAFGPRMADDATALMVKRAVQELSMDAWTDHIAKQPTVAESWLYTAKRKGGDAVLFDADGSSFSGYKLMAAVFAFGRALRPILAGQQNVGLLLPPSGGGVIANLAVLAQGKTVVNLNYTSVAEILANCAAKAEIRTVLTSKKFLDRLVSKGFDVELLRAQTHFVLLEDLKAGISKSSFLMHLLRAIVLPSGILRWAEITRTPMDSTAAILFSSGSEGVPKGVELSHLNIVGNLKQVTSLLNPDHNDVMLGSLPLFHAFGLTVTTFLPLVEGIPVVCQPDPTDAAMVGRLVARHRITLLCGTSTFLRMYAQSKRVHPLMFQSIRLVVAGAEKLRAEVRQSFREKFGLEIYEGYGTTETTPVASTNVPDILLSEEGQVQVGNKVGTVGLPLPGSTFRIVDPVSLERLPEGEAGLILIGGAQIMKGYFADPVKTGDSVVTIDGKRWYKSGDKGQLDADGFLTILDRYSRFAKLGGEMVSLGAVEKEIGLLQMGEQVEYLAVAVPDATKGEKVVLLYSAPEAMELSPDKVKERILASTMPGLMKPGLIFQVAAVPKLGTGKADYSGAKKMALELVG